LLLDIRILYREDDRSKDNLALNALTTSVDLQEQPLDDVGFAQRVAKEGKFWVRPPINSGSDACFISLTRPTPN
jgi:hypothetical protein